MTDTQISAAERYLVWLIASLFIARAVLPASSAVERFLFAVIAAALLLIAADAFSCCYRQRRTVSAAADGSPASCAPHAGGRGL